MIFSKIYTPEFLVLKNTTDVNVTKFFSGSSVLDFEHFLKFSKYQFEKFAGCKLLL